MFENDRVNVRNEARRTHNSRVDACHGFEENTEDEVKRMII
jgi:hypothetical protein